MYQNRKGLFGFTLAEVLIVLGIIGIIAEMTIPTLMNNVSNTQHVTALKEVYSILSQTGKQLAYDNGGSLIGAKIYNTGSAQTVLDSFSPYLKTAKNCGVNNVGGCFYDTPRYQIGGGLSSYNLNSSYNNSNNYATVILANGIALSFYKGFGAVGVDCVADRGDGVMSLCGTIEIDVNGAKVPNKLGRDCFGLEVLADGTVMPMGAYNTAGQIANDCNIDGGNGWDCTVKVIQEGKENY